MLLKKRVLRRGCSRDSVGESRANTDLEKNDRTDRNGDGRVEAEPLLAESLVGNGNRDKLKDDCADLRRKRGDDRAAYGAVASIGLLIIREGGVLVHGVRFFETRVGSKLSSKIFLH